MKKYHIKVKGVTPLIMHNSAGANPQNHYTKIKKPITAKRNKTDADYEKLAELDFLSSLYFDVLLGLYVPAENIQKMILEAARGCDQKKAKKAVVGVRLLEHFGYQLETDNCKDLNALMKDPKNKYFAMVTIQKAKNPHTRAIFHNWRFELDVEIDEVIVDPHFVHEWFVYAGDRVGLGSRRPYAPTPGQFGRFVIEQFEEV